MTPTALLFHRLGLISRNTLHDIMQMDVALWALIWGGGADAARGLGDLLK